MTVRILGVVLGGFLSLQACNGSDQDTASEPSSDVSSVEAETQTEPEASETTPTETTATSDDTKELETVRQADSHVHGRASLAIVREDAAISLELDTPMYNLVGFEHLPETDDQVAAVESAEDILGAPAALFQFNNAARCEPASASADIHLFGDDHDAHDHHEDHDHDEHDHGDHEDHGDHASHKDAVISYSFNCKKAENLKNFTTTLMSSFPNLTELDVVYLGLNTQKAASLTPDKTRVNLVE